MIIRTALASRCNRQIPTSRVSLDAPTIDSGNCSHGTARFHGLFLSRHGTARGHNPRLYHSTARHGELLLHFTGLHGRKPCGKRQHPSVLWPVKPSECMARHGRDNYSHCTAFHGTGCLHYKTSRHGTALHGRFLTKQCCFCLGGLVC